MTDETDRRTAESGRIGGEAGRISAESARVVAETTRDEASEFRRRGRAQKDAGQLLAYVLIVLVGAYGFWIQHENTAALERTSKEICATADENRVALRNTVLAIDALGRALITDGKPGSELDADAKADLERFDAFTASQLKTLDIPACTPK